MAHENRRTPIHDGHQVGDMVLQGGGQRRGSTGAVVTAAVVGHDVEVGEPTDDAGEAGPPVERSVDQDDDQWGPVGFGPVMVHEMETDGAHDSGPCVAASRPEEEGRPGIRGGI
jgi:hypothetical protein